MGELDVRQRHQITILGIRENGKLDLNIAAQTRLSADTTLLVLGSSRAVQKCFHI